MKKLVLNTGLPLATIGTLSLLTTIGAHAAGLEYIVIALKNSHTAKENRRITYRYNLFPNLDAFS